MSTEAALKPVKCPRHPAVETNLACARCGTPICPKCMVPAPVGNRCPDCARPVAGLATRPTLGLYFSGTAAGLGTAMLGGAVLPFLSFGFFTLLLTLLVGYLVGEAVSRSTRRLPYRGLAILAFVCAAIGPILGRACVLAAMAPFPDPVARVSFSLMGAFASLGVFGLLMAIAAGMVASSRVTRF